MAGKIVDKTGWNYTIIENQVIENEVLDIYEKMLYIALKRFANIQTGEAFPGVKRLASIGGMSERKARSVINSLVEKRFISVEQRKNKTSVYTLLPTPARYAGGAPDAVGHAQGAGGVMHEVQVGGAQGADELKKQELKRTELKKDNDKSIVANAPDINPGKATTDEKFEELWKLYPNKKGKANALKAFKRAVKQGEEYEAIEKGLIAFRNHCEANKWYSPAHGSTWFNGERWNDEYESSERGGNDAGNSRRNQPTQQYEDGINF